MLKRTLAIAAAIIVLSITSQIQANNINIQTKQETTSTQTVPFEMYKHVDSLDLVANPSKYMNKRIKIKAKFDKFSALGLDYPPAARDAKTYISFLIKRENVKGYNIPLSELKLILKRDYAEKELVNLEAGDDIEIYGSVFCAALGDPWVDVEKVTILTPKPNKEKKEQSEGK